MAANAPANGLALGSSPLMRSPSAISLVSQEELLNLLRERDESIAKLQIELTAAHAEIERLRGISPPLNATKEVSHKELTARERQWFERLKKEHPDSLQQRAILTKKVEDLNIQVQQLQARVANYEKTHDLKH